jgi:hypothetical protein
VLKDLYKYYKSSLMDYSHQFNYISMCGCIQGIYYITVLYVDFLYLCVVIYKVFIILLFYM